MLGVDFNFNIDYNKVIGEKMEITKFTQQEKDNFNNSFLEAYFLGKGDHGTAYVYPNDDKKVVLITNEYDEDELRRLITITSKLKEQGVNLPIIYDFFRPNKDKVCVLEDRIVGVAVCNNGTHGENKNKWLRLLSLPDQTVAKLFEDIETILNSGIMLDVFKSDNLIWTPQGYAFIDLHSPSEKLEYLTKELSFAAFGICDNLINESLNELGKKDKREYRESCLLKTASFFKLTNALCFAKIDEKSKDDALSHITNKWQSYINMVRNVYPHVSEGEKLEDAIEKLNNKINASRQKGVLNDALLLTSMIP